jgi:hypothetical protein
VQNEVRSKGEEKQKEGRREMEANTLPDEIIQFIINHQKDIQ